jgi:hypothetical protein
VLVALVAGCFTAGCGQSSGDRVLPAAIWSRHDALPAGVPREASETRMSGDDICPDPVSGSEPLDIRLERRPMRTARRGARPDRPQLGETLQVCPRGFDVARAVTLTLTRSDGSRTAQRLEPKDRSLASDRGYFASYFLDASWPAGAVSVTARQGSASARTSFRIGAPERRAVRVQEWFGRPALPNPLAIMVIGVRPRSTVPIDLYAQAHGPGSGYVYATTLRATSDERGVGQLRVAYDASTNGGYELRLRGARAAAAHVPICVRCCESQPDATGSEYCAN